jgi:hypothetical protein
MLGPSWQRMQQAAATHQVSALRLLKSLQRVLRLPCGHPPASLNPSLNLPFPPGPRQGRQVHREHRRGRPPGAGHARGPARRGHGAAGSAMWGTRAANGAQLESGAGASFSCFRAQRYLLWHPTVPRHPPPTRPPLPAPCPDTALQDDGVSVREAAVELLAKHIVADPGLAEDYFEVLREASAVSGAGWHRGGVLTARIRRGGGERAGGWTRDRRACNPSKGAGGHDSSMRAWRQTNDNRAGPSTGRGRVGAQARGARALGVLHTLPWVQPPHRRGRGHFGQVRCPGAGKWGGAG